MHHGPSGISRRATRSRSPEQNRREALRLLRLALGVEVRIDRTGPSDLWRARAHGGRIAVNPRHADLPALVAEALDVLARHGWDAKPAAAELGVTASQLVKLLALHPPALVRWNDERGARGLHAMRG